jgi:hypothetical protein
MIAAKTQPLSQSYPILRPQLQYTQALSLQCCLTMECKKQLLFIYSLIFLLVVLVAADGNAETTTACNIKPAADWTREQRDDARFECIKKNRLKLSVKQCMNIAKGMEYSIEADDARVYCASELAQPATITQCLLISKKIESPDLADETSWNCIRRFSLSISKTQCNQFANSMRYPFNFHRAESFCKTEL